MTFQLSATRRGARLARLLAVQQLDTWGWPYGSDVSRSLAQVVAELASNAVLHGRVNGRDFRLRLSLAAGFTLRVELVDARAESVPAPDAVRVTGAVTETPDVSETGRGLALVEAVADRWGVVRQPYPCKTVWAELDLAARAAQRRPAHGGAGRREVSG
ncbi:ATP-binding protein [Streptomyces armeniacus]|uniref:ATP-binding protein n=2 Tax=Streptomyces armeniacus TaxID=83291 RepID=A0A345Y112_9ACTN|nr:ATP-binding protein [Streptomyces armeniacus]